MIWLTWRQFRVQAIVAAVAFVALGVVLGYTGPHLVHLYHSSGITACQATPNGDCGPLIDDFTSHYPLLHSLGALIILIPGVIGVFWGAPLLARELETGTHRVAWTQPSLGRAGSRPRSSCWASRASLRLRRSA